MQLTNAAQTAIAHALRLPSSTRVHHLMRCLCIQGAVSGVPAGDVPVRSPACGPPEVRVCPRSPVDPSLMVAQPRHRRHHDDPLKRITIVVQYELYSVYLGSARATLAAYQRSVVAARLPTPRSQPHPMLTTPGARTRMRCSADAK